jgi:ankyrin repeat protein
VGSTLNDSDRNKAFLEAAARGSLTALERLLAQGADVNARTSTGKTALMRLRGRGERNPALVRLLLDHGADPGLADRHGMTALHSAVEGAGPKTVEMLLDAGADVNARDSGGRPPLWYAIRRRSVELMTLLIDRGADPNARLNLPYAGLPDAPLLAWAIYTEGGGGDPEVLRCLLDRGADPNAHWEGEWNPLYATIGRGSMPLVRLLLDYGASIHPTLWGAPTSQPLYIAVNVRRPDIVRELLERGANPNLEYNGVSPLSAAALSNQAQCVRLLLEAGADPGYRFATGELLLDLVEEAGHSQVVQLLRDALEAVSDGV